MEKISSNIEKKMFELIEKHEEVHVINDAIIAKQKELIGSLQNTVNELKEIIEKYLLKDVTP